MQEDKTKIPLTVLVVPVIVENLIRTSLMAVDQFMLYGYSEKAAAAMSAVSQFAFFIQLLYMMVASGASILISQNLGAGKKDEAGKIALGSHLLVGAFSAVISLAVVAVAGPIFSLLGLEPVVYGYATSFLAIFGGGSFFMAVNIVQANVLRAYGYSKIPMVVNAIALAITVLGNGLSLFGWFGFPVLGISGVALSNVMGQCVAFGINFVIIRGKGEIRMRWRDAPTLSGSVFRSILSIGVPSAGENLSYNIAQIVIVGFIASMGTDTLAAYGLVLTLCRYVFISSVGIGMGTQIKVGYFVGAGKHEEAQRKVYQYWLFGFALSVVLISLLNAFKGVIIAGFNPNPAITGIVGTVLLLGLILEPGRNFNTIVIPALKGSGDVKFPVFSGMAIMWTLGVPGAWFLGVRLGMGLPGIWIALCLDEWARGLVNMARWKSGAWKVKSLVKSDPA